MKKLNLLLLFLMCSSLFSAPFDVIPKNVRTGDRYVLVDKIEGDLIGFSECIWGVGAESCIQIGHKEYYAIADLKRQRSKENRQIVGAVLADIGIGATMVLGGAYIGAAATGAMSTTATTFLGAIGEGIGQAITGGIIGAGAGVGAISYVAATKDILNPAEQTRQAKTLNSEILNDEDVINDDIANFVKRLELVLNKID